MTAVVILVLVVAFCASGVIGALWLLGKAERAQKRAEAGAASLLDQTFDGRPQATYTVTMWGLTLDTVLAGASERGYKLAHQSGDSTATTLVFEKS